MINNANNENYLSDPSHCRNALFLIILSVIWFLISLIVLYLPASDIPNVKISIPHLDKGIHFLLFFIQFYLLSRLIQPTFWNTIVLLGIGIIWAGLSEYAQSAFTQTRYGDFKDALADSLGVIIALALSTFQIWKKRKSKKSVN